MNETIIYVFCLFMVYFSFTETEVGSRYALGYLFMIVFFAWSALNFALIFWQSIRRCYLLLRRYLFRSDSGKRVKKRVHSK